MEYNWLTPKAQMRHTHGKGSGSFAIMRIYKDEIVASFGGFVVHQNELVNYSEDRVSRSLQLNQNYYLLSGNIPEAGDMINHSCEPNCGILGTSSVKSLKNISIGEELTFDYAMSDSSEYDEFQCACGKEKCRGQILGSDWKLKQLQLQYKENFSSYLQKLIKFSHSECCHDQFD